MPSLSASSPQRSHVEGMNCIHPIAPAELGPMLPPKLDSTLLIAASTCHGIPYAFPAACQSAWSWSGSSVYGWEAPPVQPDGTTIEPDAFGVPALGKPAGRP